MKHIENIEFEKKVEESNSSLTNSVFINSMMKETSYTTTKNGAKTFMRTQSSLLDFYAQAGSMRNNQEKALDLFKKAFSEDNLLSIKTLFYLRDIRGGQGERKLFRVCLEWLGTDYPLIFEKIIKYVPEYGRFDDLFFDNDKCFDLISKQIELDTKSDKPSLLAKWLPTINASSDKTKQKARMFVNKLGFKNDKHYRKTIRDIRKKIKTVEELMSNQKWGSIDYSSVPSQANRIYKNAFKKHDEDRYSKFIDKAINGKTKINSSTLYPYQIYNSVKSNYSQTLEALWNQLPDYTRGKNALVVADVSGSMAGNPMSVSVSLALYFAERNKGMFKDYFITFSGNPRLQQIKGKDLRQKMNSIETAEWEQNTDLSKVFQLILKTAVQNKLQQSDLPETLYIISDMEFDYCVNDQTNYEYAKNAFESFGYKLPTVVFWNVNSSGENLPTQNDKNVSLVSGLSPVIFKIAVENKTPYEVMIDTITSDRYKQIEL